MATRIKDAEIIEEAQFIASKFPTAPISDGKYSPFVVTGDKLREYLQKLGTVSFQYRTSEDGEWSDTVVTSGQRRFKIGDNGPWSGSISIGQSITTNIQYAETNSDDDDDWHDTQADDDNWIRIVVDEIATSGIPLDVTGVTNLSVDREEDSVTVKSSTGEDAEIPAASDTEAGVLTATKSAKIDVIEAEATKNIQGAGITIESDGTTKLDNNYVDGRIDAATHYLDHFRIAYTTAYFTTEGTRWTTASQSDGSGHIIYMNPGTSHAAVLETLEDGSMIQVRNVDGTVNNTFTLEADPANPDSTGTWTLLGEWGASPSFVQSHNYSLFFSTQREVSIHTDDDTLEGSGLPDDVVKVKVDGIGAEEIDSNLSSDDKTTVRSSLDVPAGTYIEEENVAVSSNDYTLTTDADEVEGLEVVFEAKEENTDDVTVQLGSSGTVRSLRRADGEEFGSGELADETLVKATWNGSHYRSNIHPPSDTSDGTSVSTQYAETNSDDDDDWHETQTDDDEWIRVVVGDIASEGIPLTQADIESVDADRDEEVLFEEAAASSKTNGTFVSFALTRSNVAAAPDDDKVLEIRIFYNARTGADADAVLEDRFNNIELLDPIPTNLFNTRPVKATGGTTTGCIPRKGARADPSVTGSIGFAHTTMWVGKANTAGTSLTIGCTHWASFGSCIVQILEVSDIAGVAASDNGGDGGGNTNLSVTRDDDSVTVVSDTGDDAVIPAADEDDAGVATTEHITKLNAIEAEAKKVVVQYAETNSDTDSDWHETQTDDDDWIRFGLGETPTYTEGIPLDDVESTTIQYATTNSDTDSDWHATQANADKWIRFVVGSTETEGIPLTANTAGDGIEIDDDGAISVDDAYVDELIESSTQYLDAFRLAYVTPATYASRTVNEWTNVPQSDNTGHIIEIRPGDSHVAVLRELEEGSQIQVRNTDDTVNNTFTLEADPGNPDSTGTWQLFGEWEDSPSFVATHNYQLLFSVRREHSIYVDSDTMEGDGTNDDPVNVKEDGIGAREIDRGMDSATIEAEVRRRA